MLLESPIVLTFGGKERNMVVNALGNGHGSEG